MDLMTRRREMMEGEMYPVGTDIVTKYIGRNSRGWFIGESAVTIDSSGEFVSGGGYYGSPIYLPINAKYEYEKNASGRVYNLTYYDSNYRFIRRNSSYQYNNLERTKITDIPPNACYIRFVTSSSNNNWNVGIIRIA